MIFSNTQRIGAEDRNARRAYFVSVSHLRISSPALWIDPIQTVHTIRRFALLSQHLRASGDLESGIEVATYRAEATF